VGAVLDADAVRSQDADDHVPLLPDQRRSVAVGDVEDVDVAGDRLHASPRLARAARGAGVGDPEHAGLERDEPLGLVLLVVLPELVPLLAPHVEALADPLDDLGRGAGRKLRLGRLEQSHEAARALGPPDQFIVLDDRLGLDQLHLGERTTVEVLDGLSVDGSHLDDDVQLVGDEFERRRRGGAYACRGGVEDGCARRRAGTCHRGRIGR